MLVWTLWVADSGTGLNIQGFYSEKFLWAKMLQEPEKAKRKHLRLLSSPWKVQQDHWGVPEPKSALRSAWLPGTGCLSIPASQSFWGSSPWEVRPQPTAEMEHKAHQPGSQSVTFPTVGDLCSIVSGPLPCLSRFSLLWDALWCPTRCPMPLTLI